MHECRERRDAQERPHAVFGRRVARFRERRGLLERDEDNSYLTLDGLNEEPMQDIHSHAVTYRVAMGLQRGRNVFTLSLIVLSITLFLMIRMTNRWVPDRAVGTLGIIIASFGVLGDGYQFTTQLISV